MTGANIQSVTYNTNEPINSRSNSCYVLKIPHAVILLYVESEERAHTEGLDLSLVSMILRVYLGSAHSMVIDPVSLAVLRCHCSVSTVYSEIH